MKSNHNRDNLQKKEFNCGLSWYFKYEFITIMAGNIAEGRQAWCTGSS